MNDDSDLECTCDVGPLADCPVCRNRTPEPIVYGRRKLRKFETQSVDDRIAEIKAGYR